MRSESTEQNSEMTARWHNV